MTTAEGTYAPAHPAHEGRLGECLRACEDHLGGLAGTRDRDRLGLAECLRKVDAVLNPPPPPPPPPSVTRPPTVLSRLKRAVRSVAPVSTGTGSPRTPGAASRTPGAASRTPGGTAGPTATQATGPSHPAEPSSDGPVTLSGPLLDALLATAHKALDCGYEEELALALRISDTITAECENSRAGRRLRGRVLEAAGDEAGAAEAYERYLETTEDDQFGAAAKAAGLRRAHELDRELAGLLARDCPSAEEFAGGPATELWAEGLRLHANGDHPAAEPRLVGALLSQLRAGAPVAERRELLGQYVGLRFQDADGSADPAASFAALTGLLAHHAETRRSRMRGPVADPFIGGVEWLSLGEFRNRIAGKSICLVANSSEIAGSSLGEEIDAYDLVVRFNAYRTEAEHTGVRTDIHVTGHRHSFNWSRPVETRIVFAANSWEWKQALRDRLVPGAQRCLGDESLRSPLRNIGRAGREDWPAEPTCGFNTLWLLDFLDVSPVLDLIGFDFHAGGVHRLQAAMRIPVPAAADSRREKDWVMERAQRVTDLRISLR